MTDPVFAPDAAPTRPHGPGVQRTRRLSWLCPVSIPLAAFVWNAGAALVDATPLGDGGGLYGFGFAAAIYSFMVGAPVFVLCLGATAIAAVVPTAARGAFVTGAVACALAGFALGLLGLVTLVQAADGSEAAYALVTCAAAVVLFAPGWLAWDVTVAER
ncbi:hypothetical protein [Nocardioides gilvus]|uniref:hypothetical protein n=1 Tax=Nocardioides gilvus TaxID=1735589 RepID=UPI000D745938|nr:hypothetical protein [Nocardioides gilvus]